MTNLPSFGRITRWVTRDCCCGGGRTTKQNVVEVVGSSSTPRLHLLPEYISLAINTALSLSRTSIIKRTHTYTNPSIIHALSHTSKHLPTHNHKYPLALTRTLLRTTTGAGPELLIFSWPASAAVFFFFRNPPITRFSFSIFRFSVGFLCSLIHDPRRKNVVIGVADRRPVRVRIILNGVNCCLCRKNDDHDEIAAVTMTMTATAALRA